jgi:hypothetical protein
MKILGARLVTLASLVGMAGLLVNMGCGGGNGSGTGGAGGHAGAGGHGGASAGNGGHGGGTGSAGASGTAGASAGASGAAGASAGASGTAGASAGASGTGGQAGSTTDGGSKPDGGGIAAFAYYFDTSAEGFVLNKAIGSGNLANVDGGTPATLSWDSQVGHPTPGSLQVGATFTTYGQFVLTSIFVTPLIDASGRTAQAWVMLDPSDGGAAFSGSAQLQANSGTNYDSADGAFTTLTPGVWTLLTLNLAAVPPFDPAHLNTISVLFVTGSGPDGGALPSPVQATFHIDSVTDGSGGSPPPPLSYTFDTTSEGFQIASQIVTPDGGAQPAVSWDSMVGDPSRGSLAVAAEFTNYGQSISVYSDVYPVVDLTGKIIHAKVRLDSGTLPAGYAQLHASSGSNYVYVQAANPTPLTAGSWLDLSLDLAAAKAAQPNFDPTQIIDVGVEIGTDVAPADGGAFPTPVPLSFHIDSIVAE